MLTYIGWMQSQWNAEVESLDADGRYNFVRECEAYVAWRATNETQRNNRTLFNRFRGFPDCDRLLQPTSALYRDLLRMDGPGASFVSWGSHQPGMGVTTGNLQRLMSSENYGASFFHRFPALMVGTTDSWAAGIPRKFGRQFLVRNDERISAQNALVAYALARLREADPGYGGCQAAAPRSAAGSRSTTSSG